MQGSIWAKKMDKSCRLAWLFLIAAFCLLPPVLYAEEESQIDKLFDQAVAEYKAGNKDAALKLLNQVIEQQPDMPNAYFKRALIYGENEATYSQALSDFKHYVKLKPNSAVAWGNLGTVLLMQGKFSQAQAALDKQLELEPDSVSSTLNLGFALLLQGRAQQARNYFQQSLPMIPNEPSFQAALAGFDLFIEKGWKVEVCKREQTWMAEQYESYAPYRQALAQLTEAMRYQNEEDYQAAFKVVEEVLAFYRENLSSKHPLQNKIQRIKANLHFYQGRAFQKKSQHHKAINSFQQALLILEKQYSHGDEVVAIVLYNLATLYLHLGQYTEAKTLIERTLVISEKVYGPDHPKVATVLINLAGVYGDLGQYAEAKSYYERALVIKEKVYGPDHTEVATGLNELASVYSELGQYVEAKASFKRALAIWEKEYGPDHELIAIGHNNLAMVCHSLGEYTEAKRSSERAVAILEKEYGSDHEKIATVLSNLALVYQDQEEYAEAITLIERALTIWEQHYGPDDANVARGLNNLASVYFDLGHYTGAKMRYERALTINEKEYGPDHIEVAAVLNNLAGLYDFLGEYAEAKICLERSLAINEKVYGPDHIYVATALNNLALLYSDLGQFEEAKTRYERALVIKEKVYGLGHTEVATGLSNLAGVYYDTGQYAEAKVRYERALAIWEKVYGPDHTAVAGVLNQLGLVYHGLGKYAEGKMYYERALAILEKVTDMDHANVAAGLTNLASVYYNTGQYMEAKTRLEQGLVIAQNVHSPELLWLVQGHMSVFYTKQNKPDTAIFYGKQAVNSLQSQRGRLQSMEKGLQSSFLKKVEGAYKGLADLLVSEGRLPEAQQVLDMLKESEYLDFTQRDLPKDATSQASYTEFETQQLAVLDKVIQPLRKVTESMGKLITLKPEQRSPEQQIELNRLRDQKQQAIQAFKGTLSKIEHSFAQLSEQQSQQQATKLDLPSDQRKLIKGLGTDVLLVQYLVLEDQTRILITGSDIIHSISVPSGARELNPLVQAFYSQLKDPRQDPRPQGKKLYTQLIEPIEGLLQQYQPKTLMLYLDGILRYIPLGALHDGKQFLAERYALPIYTAAARKQLDGQRKEQWRFAGLGVSKAHESFSALPAVEEELKGIVQSGEQDENGILPGVVYLDEQFNQSTLKGSLRQDYPVLHLATHFAFHPGNEKHSFLLLGNGEHLDLGSLRTDDSYKFQGIDLLTLSACETALDSPGAKGQEIEGLGTLAQKRGAKSVLATLWSVADKSTGQFMRKLYQLREEKRLSKAEALRQAQLAFIHGGLEDARQEDSPLQADNRGLLIEGLNSNQQKARGLAMGYRHPYYWAPFILMGNWL